MRHHRLRIDPPRPGPLLSAPLVLILLAGWVRFASRASRRGATTSRQRLDPRRRPPAGSVAAGRLVLVHRVLAQDQGDWQVDYGFKNAGAEAIALLPKDIAARVEGWLSNSRIAAHANPRALAVPVEGQSPRPPTPR